MVASLQNKSYSTYDSVCIVDRKKEENISAKNLKHFGTNLSLKSWTFIR